jgi:CBS domain-containing protein
MVEVPVLKLTDQITKARQILRDLKFREVYVTDARKVLLGYVDITDALRVTATKSNVTLEGYIKDAAHVSGDVEVERMAKLLWEFRTDSVAIVNGQKHITGGVLLSALFPVIISRNELRGLVSDHMTKKVVTATHDEPLQKIYSMIVESGFTAFRW